MATIICLFSVDNNFDQPTNNLLCWWNEKPSIEKLHERIFYKKMNISSDINITATVNIWQGKIVRVDEADLRLESVIEDIILG